MIRAERVVRLVAVTLIVCGAAGTVAAFTSPAVPIPAPEPSPPSQPSTMQLPARPDSLARRIAARNPFRMSRSPASTAFGAEPRAPAPAVPARPPRPQLVLAGVILGEEPAALVDGLPGTDGTRLMRLGERVGDYELRSLAGDSAVIAASDTVWTLRLRTRFP